MGILICVVGLFINIIAAQEQKINNKLNSRAKVLINDAVYKANNLDFAEIGNYTYSIFNLFGEVLYSNDIEYSIGSKVELRILSGVSKGDFNSEDIIYSTPFIQNGIQEGLIYVTIPYNQVILGPQWNLYAPAVLLVTFILVFLYFVFRIVTKDILEPIREIHKVTNKIRDGYLEKRLYYDYDGEIGTLCHDFEALRSDLSFSTENEKKLKEKEKLLMAYISHDLKTPIASISGYVEGIHNDIVKGDRVHECDVDNLPEK